MDMSKTTQIAGNTPFAATVSYSLVDVTPGPNSLAAGKANLRTQYIPQTSNPGQAQLMNPLSTTEKGESIKIASSTMANVYNGSNVNPLYFYPVKSGKRIHMKLDEYVAAETSKDGSTYSTVTLPYSASLTIVAPDALLSLDDKASIVRDTIVRLVSQWFPQGTGDLANAKDIIAGKLI